MNRQVYRPRTRPIFWVLLHAIQPFSVRNSLFGFHQIKCDLPAVVCLSKAKQKQPHNDHEMLL